MRDRGCPHCRKAARGRVVKLIDYSEFIRFMIPSVYFINPKKELVYSGTVLYGTRPKNVCLGRREMLMIDVQFQWQLACCLLRELSRSERFRRIFVCWIYREVMYSREYKDNADMGYLVPELTKKRTNYIEIEFSRPRPKGEQADNSITKHIVSQITLNLATFLSTNVRCIVPEKKWACLLLPLVVQKLNLEYVMACLSTLGGAHSSLGENSQLHAKLAGIMSVKQLAIASKLNDPVLASHCRIYFAHSLIQTGKWKDASKVIRKEYKWAVSSNGRSDSKLITCCRAAWARVLYFKKQKKLISHEAMRNE